MKNLYIHGHFVSDNYGDFLLFYVLRNVVEKYENKYNWFTSNVDESYDKYCKINRKNVRDAIKMADLSIFTGGGYFGEPDKKKIRWNIRCLIRHILPAYKIYKRKIPYIIVGVETGPISFFLNRILIRKIFDGAEKVSVRNEESKIFLKKIKVKREIEVNPDWIMGIDKNEFLIDDVDYNFINDKNKKYIFVHLSSGINVPGMENVIKDLKNFQKKHKNIIYLFGCDQENQKEKVKTLFNRFDNKKNQLFYYKSPWELSTILKNVDSVITDKLHVGIVATRYGKEVICTARDPKSLRFYNLIRRNECVSLLKNVNKGETLHKLEKLKFKKIFIDNKIFEKAKNNKKIVEDFLNKY